MRAGATAARKPRPVAPIPPPPLYQAHEVMLRLHHHFYELAAWAYAYEQQADAELARLHRGRPFEQFLADCLEAGLEPTVEHWKHRHAEPAPGRGDRDDAA
jgi:hypothetical protein